MGTLTRAALVILAALAVCGCIQTKEEYTLNPDGSGKVVVEAIFVN